MKTAAAAAHLLLLASSCGPPPGTRFDGRAEAPVATPEDVVELTGQPEGVETLGELHAACTPLKPSPSFQGVRLSDLDCSERRLRLSLRETAAARGGNVLLDVTCRQKDGLECQAGLGRSVGTQSRTLVDSARRQRLAVKPNVRGELGYGVHVDFRASRHAAISPPRSEDNVRELSVLPLSHTSVGVIETRCEACEELGSRDALRIAAARMGISDVVGVRCFPLSSGFRCVGEGALPQVLESPL